MIKLLCKCCSNEIEEETNLNIDYPFVCPSCDENKYSFEVETETELKRGYQDD